MGCAGSKEDEEPIGASASSAPNGSSASGLPGSKVPPSLEQARSDPNLNVAREPRLSVKYQSRELLDGGNLSRGSRGSRRSSAPFDRARIGTHTRHGITPGPRGFSAAKINQDRGVVCWPFNGSYNQALLCIFDGHGSKGEKASEFCMKSMPEMLEANHEALKADPAACLHTQICKMDRDLLGGPLGQTAMTCGTTSNVVYMRGNDVWVACSGDSRCVLGAMKGGAFVGSDMSGASPAADLHPRPPLPPPRPLPPPPSSTHTPHPTTSTHPPHHLFQTTTSRTCRSSARGSSRPAAPSPRPAPTGARRACGPTAASASRCRGASATASARTSA